MGTPRNTTPPPPPAKPVPPLGRAATLARQFALAVELPFVFVATVLIGGGIGYWLDSRFHTSPLFLLVLGALGLVAGLRELVRRAFRAGTGRG
jgi:F0F1-type ATP synthase assembly protein I